MRIKYPEFKKCIPQSATFLSLVPLRPSAQVEDGDFTPMVMASTGAINDEMSMAIKHLAKSLSRKIKQDYSKVIGILRCQLAFELARSALVCLRGSRSIRSYVQPCDDPFSAPDLAAAELL